MYYAEFVEIQNPKIKSRLRRRERWMSEWTHKEFLKLISIYYSINFIFASHTFKYTL